MKRIKYKNKIIESKKLLIVEGKDECNFFEALLKHEHVNGVQVISVGGKDKFKTELPNLVNGDGFSEVDILGFIRDAEENQAQSAFSSICSTLKKNNLPAPKSINQVIIQQNIRIGVFIMPNNVDEGMLEDLCLQSINRNPLYRCVDKYFECCLSQISENKKINIAKAKVQAYLATQNSLVSSLGLAAKKGYWDLEDSCFVDIKKFLHNLFMS